MEQSNAGAMTEVEFLTAGIIKEEPVEEVEIVDHPLNLDDMSVKEEPSQEDNSLQESETTNSLCEPATTDRDLLYWTNVQVTIQEGAAEEGVWSSDKNAPIESNGVRPEGSKQQQQEAQPQVGMCSWKNTQEWVPDTIEEDVSRAVVEAWWGDEQLWANPEAWLGNRSSSKAPTQPSHRNPAPKKRGRPPKIKGQKSAPPKKIASASTKAARTEQRRERREKMLSRMSDPKYRRPFEYGWIREVVIRTTSMQPAIERKYKALTSKDIYYFTPMKQKLRSTNEVYNYLLRTPLEYGSYQLTVDNFTFLREPLGVGEEFEIIRHAGRLSRMSKVFKKRKITKPYTAMAPKKCKTQSMNGYKTFGSKGVDCKHSGPPTANASDTAQETETPPAIESGSGAVDAMNVDLPPPSVKISEAAIDSLEDSKDMLDWTRRYNNFIKQLHVEKVLLKSSASFNSETNKKGKRRKRTKLRQEPDPNMQLHKRRKSTTDALSAEELDLPPTLIAETASVTSATSKTPVNDGTENQAKDTHHVCSLSPPPLSPACSWSSPSSPAAHWEVSGAPEGDAGADSSAVDDQEKRILLKLLRNQGASTKDTQDLLEPSPVSKSDIDLIASSPQSFAGFSDSETPSSPPWSTLLLGQALSPQRTSSPTAHGNNSVEEQTRPGLDTPVILEDIDDTSLTDDPVKVNRTTEQPRTSPKIAVRHISVPCTAMKDGKVVLLSRDATSGNNNNDLVNTCKALSGDTLTQAEISKIIAAALKKDCETVTLKKNRKRPLDTFINNSQLPLDLGERLTPPNHPVSLQSPVTVYKQNPDQSSPCYPSKTPISTQRDNDKTGPSTDGSTNVVVNTMHNIPHKTYPPASSSKTHGNATQQQLADGIFKEKKCPTICQLHTSRIKAACLSDEAQDKALLDEPLPTSSAGYVRLPMESHMQREEQKSDINRAQAVVQAPVDCSEQCPVNTEVYNEDRYFLLSLLGPLMKLNEEDKLNFKIAVYSLLRKQNSHAP